MTRKDHLPDFYIIGAAKSGTTTLFDVLKQNPQVDLSKIKEPRFFSNDAKYAKGTDWYLETFFNDPGETLARGEASPQYLYWSEKAAPRLKETYGDSDVKFIAIFRHPVERAYSHYWHAYRYGWEEWTFPEAIKHEDERVREFLATHEGTDELFFMYYEAGLYAAQLKPFLNIFPRDRFLFLLQNDLAVDFNGTISRLLEFIGLDPSIQLAPIVSNRASLPRSLALVNWLKHPAQSGSIKSFLKLLAPLSVRTKVKRTLRRANQRVTNYPPMDPKLRKSLAERYIESIKELEPIIDRDLSSWLTAKK